MKWERKNCCGKDHLPGDDESAGRTGCSVWSIEIATKLMLCAQWSKPLEFSTIECPPITCFLEADCPKLPFIKPVGFGWGLYKGLGEEGRVLSGIKLISGCCREEPLLFEDIPSDRDLRSCRGHLFISDPPAE